MLVEIVDTFLIVQLGTAYVMSAVFTDAVSGLFQIAAGWMIAVTVAIACTASISGAHLNPEISLSFAMVRPSKAFGWSKVIPLSCKRNCEVYSPRCGFCENLWRRLC